MDRGAVGHHPPRPAGIRGGRRPPHPPPAAGRFLFFEALGLDRQVVQPHPHHGRHRRAPVARGSRDAAPLLPSHARGRGGSRLRRHGHFPGGPANCWTYARPCTRRRCRPFDAQERTTDGWLAAPCRRGYPERCSFTIAMDCQNRRVRHGRVPCFRYLHGQEFPLVGRPGRAPRSGDAIIGRRNHGAEPPPGGVELASRGLRLLHAIWCGADGTLINPCPAGTSA